MDIDDLAGGRPRLPAITRYSRVQSRSSCGVQTLPPKHTPWGTGFGLSSRGEEIKPHEVCVTPYKPLIVQSLNSAGIQTHELRDRKRSGNKVPGVRLGSMKRIKGLEFRAVLLWHVQISTTRTRIVPILKH